MVGLRISNFAMRTRDVLSLEFALRNSHFAILVCALLAPSMARAQSLPEGPGKKVFESVCSLCHAPTSPMGKQWTRAQWEAKVIEMLQEEPDVTAEERATILDYLSANFRPGGKIYINLIVAKDLVTLLGISTSAADAIVQYRMTKGEFRNLDDLKNVPGLDMAKVEAKKSQLQF